MWQLNQNAKVGMNLVVIVEKIFKIVFVFACVIGLTACGSYLKKQDAVVVEQADFSQQIKPTNTTSSAVLALIKKARVDAIAGNINKAMLRLERAIRIEPRNATVWHYMAKLFLQQENYTQASGYAAKSNSLAAGKQINKNLKIDNWRIIAHARFREGNIKGAQKAQDKVNKLQQQ